MAAHQITINPLSGGIGTAPAGVVPYASDMWGVNAVRVPQVGTPSARTQAKALTVGIAGRATTGDVSISFTSRLSPPAIVQAPQWGTATLSFPFTVEADSCPSRSAFGTAALATLRDVGIPSVAQLPALAGEPAIVSIATVTPGRIHTGHSPRPAFPQVGGRRLGPCLAPPEFVGHPPRIVRLGRGL